MCGVAAVLRPQGGAGDIAQALVQAQVHRGPDAQGLWTQTGDQVALGHTRLAVICPEDGEQPFVAPDGQTVCVVNGEIYGHRAMRAELQAQGHHFATGSDCEVVLHAFLQHGQAAFGMLQGEWCAIIWQSKARRLWVARDRFGAKTCVFRSTAEGVQVASEAKALLATNGPRRWDLKSWSWITQLQYLPSDRTLFEGIRMLPPGGLLVVDDEGPRLQRWSDDSGGLGAHAFGAGAPRVAQDPVVTFREAFVQSVQDRLQSDAPLCFHLSGGIDSASVLGAATQLSGQRQDAFTVSFVGSPLDECELAQKTADFNGARLHVVHVHPQDILQSLGAAARAGEGLGVNGHLSAHFLMDREIARQGFKSVLSGEGADELLAGYPHLRQDWAQHNNQPFDDVDDQALRGLMLAGAGPVRLPALGGLEPVPAFLRAKAGIGARLQSWLQPDLRLPEPPPLLHGFEANRLKGRHPVDVGSALWARWALGGYILPTLSDRMLGAHGLEGRLPFLDPRLFDLVHRWPMHLRIRKGVEKWVLREAMRGLVPEPVRIRRKHPFLAPCPVLSGGAASLRMAEEMLEPSTFAAGALFDPERVLETLRGLQGRTPQERLPYSPPLMLVLSAHAIAQAYRIDN